MSVVYLNIIYAFLDRDFTVAKNVPRCHSHCCVAKHDNLLTLVIKNKIIWFDITVINNIVLHFAV